MTNRLFVATRKGLFTLARNGSVTSKWEIERTDFLADNVTLVMPDRRNDYVFAALDHGHFGVKLHRSVDGGAKWEEVASPKYPEPPEGSEEKCPMSGITIPWSLKLIWALAGGGADHPERLWCGTVPGGLFISENLGGSWTMVRSLWDEPKRAEWFGGGLDYPGIHSICVDPRNSDQVFVGVSCGGVWKTEDAGATWQCCADGMWADYMPPERKNEPYIQDPHCVVQCAKNPNVLWAQHHNGVFRSTDGAKSWSEVDTVVPSCFGFAVAVHPDDPEVAWFVPAIKDEKRIPVDGKVVVARTRDGGKSFEVLRNGLPQQQAYDLTFRHALDVDSTGERLAFGSTTGSLWVTDNQGDSWELVTSHLPQIYCVRFG